MYLTQAISTLLFTIIHIILQWSLIFLISHLASRTRNLTYQERINGGFLSGIQYLLFTKFSPGRGHHLGRFYIALALVITLALHYLPTLLSDLYPVQPVVLPSNRKQLDIFTAYIKTTSLVPNRTSVENILFSMGVPLNGSIFDSYVAPPVERLPCRIARREVHCSNETFKFGGLLYDDYSLAVGLHGGINGLPRIQNGTTLAGERFEYFNATDDTGSYGLAQMFVDAGQAETKNFYDMSFSSPRSLETCLTKNSRDHRCIRHSLGYLLSDTYRLFLITRRVYTLTLARKLSQTFNTTVPNFVDPSVDTTLDCSRLPTSTLETMCRQINSLGAPPMYRLYTMQKRTIDQNGRTHWDVVTTRMDLMLSNNLINNTIFLTLEAFHLDVGAEYYNSTLDKNRGFLAIKDDNISLLKFMGRETFETTYFVPDRTVSPYNHSWVDWGFSQEDIRNLTTFLLGGTVLNNGTLMIQTPVLLADVSNLTVLSLLGASVIMVVLGLSLSRNVDSAVRDPITEVLPKVLDSRRPGGSKKESIPSLRYRRVANLTLVSSQASVSPDPDSVSSLASTFAPHPFSLQDVGVDSDSKKKASPRTTKTLVLHMEIDSDDDEINAIELFEATTKDSPPTSSSFHGQSHSSAALSPETRRLSITASTFP